MHTAGGKSLDLPRYAFLDTANPANLIIKVSQSTEDELRVRSYYSWSLSESSSISRALPIGVTSTSQRDHSLHTVCPTFHFQ